VVAEDTREALRTLASETLQVAARDGRWSDAHHSLTSPRAIHIDGAVIALVDIEITEHKLADVALREARAALQGHFTDQTAQLYTAKALQTALRKTQAVLRQRFFTQTAELEQSRLDIKKQERTRR